MFNCYFVKSACTYKPKFGNRGNLVTFINNNNNTL